MSKQITNGELAEIVAGLLVERLGESHLDTKEKYRAFMTDLAQVICDHCGGEVSGPADDDVESTWMVGIRGNDSLPPDGGVWKDYDPDGALVNEDGETDPREARP